MFHPQTALPSSRPRETPSLMLPKTVSRSPTVTDYSHCWSHLARLWCKSGSLRWNRKEGSRDINDLVPSLFSPVYANDTKIITARTTVCGGRISHTASSHVPPRDEETDVTEKGTGGPSSTTWEGRARKCTLRGHSTGSLGLHLTALQHDGKGRPFCSLLTLLLKLVNSRVLVMS